MISTIKIILSTLIAISLAAFLAEIAYFSNDSTNEKLNYELESLTARKENIAIETARLENIAKSLETELAAEKLKLDAEQAKIIDMQIAKAATANKPASTNTTTPPRVTRAS